MSKTTTLYMIQNDVNEINKSPKSVRPLPMARYYLSLALDLQRKSDIKFEEFKQIEDFAYSAEIDRLEKKLNGYEARSKDLMKKISCLITDYGTSEEIKRKNTIYAEIGSTKNNFEEISASNGLMDKLKSQIDKLKSEQQTIAKTSVNDVRSSKIRQALGNFSKIQFYLIAEKGITSSNVIANRVATSSADDADQLTNLAEAYSKVSAEARKYAYPLNISDLGSKEFIRDLEELDGYDFDNSTVKTIETVNEISDILAKRKADLLAAKSEFEAEFTMEKLTTLVEATETADRYYDADVNLDFLKLQKDKYKTDLYASIESGLNAYAPLETDIIQTDNSAIEKNNIKDEIIENYRNAYEQIICWYKLVRDSFAKMLGITANLDFNDLDSVKAVIAEIKEKIKKCESETSTIEKSLKESKTAISEKLQRFSNEKESAISQAIEIFSRVIGVNAKASTSNTSKGLIDEFQKEEPVEDSNEDEVELPATTVPEEKPQEEIVNFGFNNEEVVQQSVTEVLNFDDTISGNN